MDWINLAQDKGKWLTVVNVVMGSIKVAKFLDSPSNCQLTMKALGQNIYQNVVTFETWTVTQLHNKSVSAFHEW